MKCISHTLNNTFLICLEEIIVTAVTSIAIEVALAASRHTLCGLPQPYHPPKHNHPYIPEKQKQFALK